MIEGDYAVCMQHLMRFPALCEVNYLVQRALHLKNPVCGMGVAILTGVVALCCCGCGYVCNAGMGTPPSDAYVYLHDLLR